MSAVEAGEGYFRGDRRQKNSNYEERSQEEENQKEQAGKEKQSIVEYNVLDEMGGKMGQIRLGGGGAPSKKRRLLKDDVSHDIECFDLEESMRNPMQ